ncbi:M56 family metallopeptidase [Sphingomonas sp.]|jgi:beta-lactamase regulating signal transducer with metallopeptidase domain|uniref:M56 family metallopeptidase n=1 Tax=Sphingomonas sp. TaxID=28214 RepID=UPI002D7F5E5D|nr:M56 family metallopeptidase [Sphingomonas sp.]HEU0043501.1 M56 family metallopeptidase [Sphingomonas sp.]
MLPDLAMLVAIGWKSALVAGAVLALLGLCRGRSAGERSAIAHLGLLAVAVIPIGSLMLPSWNPLPMAGAAPDAGLAAVRSGIAAPAYAQILTSGYDLKDIGVALYLVPLTLLLAAMLLSIIRLFGLRRRAAVLVDGVWLAALARAQHRMGFKDGTALLVSDELRSPISWGVIRPTIVLDERAVEAAGEAEAIIAHELAQIVRRDSAKLLFANLVCALFWFNPLVWWLARGSHQCREEAADDAVLRTEIGDADYAALLVTAARHDNGPLLRAAHGVAPGRHSLQRRIARVLDRTRRRAPATGRFVTAGAILALLATAPLAALDPFAATARGVPVAAVTAVSPVLTVAVFAAPPAPAPRPLVAAQTRPSSPPVLASLPSVRPSLTTIADDLSVEQAIDARASGIEPAYVAAMRAVFPDCELDSIVKAHTLGLDASYARALLAADPSLSMRDVVRAHLVGIPAAYHAEMRRLFPDVTMNQLTAMRAVGVTGDYVRTTRAAGQRLDDPKDAVSARAIDTDGSPPRRGTAVSMGFEGMRIEAVAEAEAGMALTVDTRG